MGKGRANGEGSIDWVESKQRYRARVSLPDGTRKAVYGKTRAEVGAKLTELLKAAKDHLPVPSEVLTVSAYLSEWLATHGSTIRPSTAERYRGMVDLHVKPGIGRIRLARLEVRDLDRLFANMLASKLAPATVRQARAIVGRALRDAERKGLVARNVARLTTSVKVERQEMRCFDAEQARRFVAAAEGERLGALLILTVCHGLRQGEVLGLRWEDVDLVVGTVTVRNQLQAIPKRGDEPRRWVLVPPKTQQSRRIVPLSSVAWDALRRHRAAQAEERMERGPAWDPSWNLVFANEVGRPIDHGNLQRRVFLPVLERAGLPVIRFHDLRHTAATLQLESGQSPHVVSGALGHNNVSTTMNVYAHVTQGQRADLARAVDGIFGR